MIRNFKNRNEREVKWKTNFEVRKGDKKGEKKVKYLIYIFLGNLLLSSCYGKFQPKRKIYGEVNINKEYDENGNLLKLIKKRTRSSGWIRHPHNMSFVKEKIKEYSDNNLIKITKKKHFNSQKHWHQVLKNEVKEKIDGKWIIIYSKTK